MSERILLDVDEILKRCSELSDESYLKNVEALVPTDWEIMGVRTPDIRRLASEYSKQIKLKSDFQAIINYLDESFKRRNLTLVALGLEIINKRSALLDRTILANIKKWIPSMSDWAVADGIAITLTSRLLKEGLIEMKDIDFLKKHSNVFGRRIYIVSMVLPLRSIDCDIRSFLSETENFIPERDKYIYKAISWVLREGTRHFQKEISAFVEKHSWDLHSSVVREVRNKLETGKKNR